MKYYSILEDYIAHTVMYLVRADSEAEALEKFAVDNVDAEKLDSGRWHVRDHRNSGKDKYYDNVYDLTMGEMVFRKEDRFEIMEVDFDPDKDCQEIFCSREKKIRWSIRQVAKEFRLKTIVTERPKWLYKLLNGKES